MSIRFKPGFALGHGARLSEAMGTLMRLERASRLPEYCHPSPLLVARILRPRCTPHNLVAGHHSGRAQPSKYYSCKPVTFKGEGCLR